MESQPVQLLFRIKKFKPFFLFYLMAKENTSFFESYVFSSLHQSLLPMAKGFILYCHVFVTADELLTLIFPLLSLACITAE